MTTPQDTFQLLLIGIGATAFMDAWLALLKRMGVRTLDFALIGRWVGHLVRGRVAHAAIAKAAPGRGELALGWLTHYAVGIAFAGVLVASQGMAWMQRPSALPAIAVGALTVMVPLFVMQPAMGAGFAGSKTPSPFRNCLRSLANHTVFGVGLYVSAVALSGIAS